MNYRTEIDGLRALAVVPVILFHAGYELSPGGFVGVDIFFVISGYLITSILVTDIEKGDFSIVGFYERRARRILPALLLVVIASILAGIVLFDNTHMVKLGNSLVAVSTFSSNIYFYLTSGYFDTSSEFKPLLHTWSLAVEEQYYVLFPIFLLVVWRFGRSTVFFLIVVIAALSLALSEYGWRHDVTANFFLTPSRAWELLAGSIVAFIVQTRGVRPDNVLSMLGVAAILYSIFVFDETTPFPSLYSLVPVTGTLLIIMFAGAKTWVARILSLKVIVRMGLISYSAYLWHQPLLAYSKYYINRENIGVKLPIAELGYYQTITLLITTFILSVLSWRYVEQPFRRRGGTSGKYYVKAWFLGSVTSLLILLIVGALIHVHYKPATSRTMEFRMQSFEAWSNDAMRDKCLLSKHGKARHDQICFQQDKDVLLWGDSHAGSLSIGLRKLFSERGVGFTQLTQSSCGPLLNIPVLLQRKNCNSVNKSVLEEISGGRYKRVILHAAWLHEHYPLTVKQLASKLEKTILAINEISPRSDIYVVGAVPRWKNGPEGKTVIHSEKIDSRYSDEVIVLDEINNVIANVAIEFNSTFIDPSSLLCSGLDDNPRCLIGTMQESEEGFVYAYTDAEHLSTQGSLFLSRLIVNQVLR